MTDESARSHIACPKCGQKLAIPRESGIIHVTCPRCRASWDWPAPSASSAKTDTGASPGSGWRRWEHGPKSTAPPKPFWRRRSAVLLLLLLALGAYVGYYRLTYIPARPLSGPAEIDGASRRPIWTAPPEEPLPENGSGKFNFDRATAKSKLQIVPRSDHGNMVVKVEDAMSDQLVCWLFVAEGQAAETPIPPGKYHLKLASGRRWYGESHLFGPDASYTTITTEIKIPTNADFKIDLYPKREGTLYERQISPREF